MTPPKARAQRRTPSTSKRPPRRLRDALILIAGGVVVVAALLTVYLRNRSSSSSGGSYPYQVGAPGPGGAAPPIHLTATNGSTFDLAAARGKTVLLYFQEGVGCEPCWTQLTDIQRDRQSFAAAHIDEIVTITGDPMSALSQKVSDEHITSIPVLSDADLAVSQKYKANQYGMMGRGADGHTFILVGPDGSIRWRADYGGAPNYTMFVPVNRLLADLHKGAQ